MKNQNPLPFTASPFSQILKAKCFWCVLVLFTLTVASSTALYAQEDLFASINGPDSPALGHIFEYNLAGTQVNTLGTFSNPRGLAFDSAGDLFVATTFFSGENTSQSAIHEIFPGGNRTILGRLPKPFNFASAVAVDSSGNVFVMGGAPNGTTTIFEFTSGGTRSVFGTVPGQGLGLTFDSAGNLFAADSSDQTIFKFTPGGASSIFAGPSAFTSNSGPAGLAFNSAGNLFVSTETNGLGGADSILEFTPGGMESTFATGLTTPRGIAFDSSDNLYVAEVGIPAPGDILKFTPNGTESTFASGIGTTNNRGPEYLAFGPAINNTPDSASTLLLLTIGLFGLVTWQRCGSPKQRLD